MKKLLLLVATVAAAVVPNAPSAHAQCVSFPPPQIEIPCTRSAPAPYGFLCGFSSVSDPQVEGSQTGEVDGGPLVLGDAYDPAVFYTGSITCTIQVNQSTHAGADACAVTGPTTPVAGEVAGTCTYASATGDNVYLCTEVDIVNGPTLYWDSVNDVWSTEPNVGCSLDITVEPGEEGGPIHELELLIDSIICPVLATLLPPQGDIPGLWDCPPYGA